MTNVEIIILKRIFNFFEINQSKMISKILNKISYGVNIFKIYSKTP